MHLSDMQVFVFDVKITHISCKGNTSFKDPEHFRSEATAVPAPPPLPPPPSSNTTDRRQERIAAAVTDRAPAPFPYPPPNGQGSVMACGELIGRCVLRGDLGLTRTRVRRIVNTHGTIAVVRPTHTSTTSASRTSRTDILRDNTSSRYVPLFLPDGSMKQNE